VDLYVGERVGMGSTAIGREASRVSTRGDGRAGPDREHARREPFSVRMLCPAYFDIYGGERVGMGSTAIGREARCVWP
jgi:hypothetical protein